jgi:hypothetical protein
MNNDGNPDLIVTGCSEGYQCLAPYPGVVSVLLGKGDGSFESAIVSHHSGGYYANAIAVADVNGDGKPDVMVENYCEDKTHYGYACAAGSDLGILDGVGTGGLAVPMEIALAPEGFPPFTTSLAAADLNGDGKPDLIVGGAVLLNITPQSATTTTVSSVPNPSIYGRPVTFTAEVTSSVGVAKGSVTFMDGTYVLGSAHLAGGKARFAISNLQPGTHNITANFSGPWEFLPSSAGLVQTVNQ